MRRESCSLQILPFCSVLALTVITGAFGQNDKSPASSTGKTGGTRAAGVRLAEVRCSPQKYSGQTVHLQGYIEGQIVSSSGVTLIFRAPEGDKIFVRAGALSVEIKMGTAVETEMRIPPNSGYVDVLELVSIKSSPPPKLTSVSPGKPASSPGPIVGSISQPSPGAAPAAGGEASPRSNGAPKTKEVLLTNRSLPSRGGTANAVAPPLGMVSDYKRTIRQFNPRLEEARLTQLAEAVIAFSLQNKIDPRLTVAVIAAESGFRLEATSRSGAMGLGQLMPGTAAGMGVTNAYDPVQNIQAAVRLISGHMQNYKNHPDGFYRALAAYNAGSGAVRRHGGVPPYRQTVNYIWKIYYLYKQLAPEQFK